MNLPGIDVARYLLLLRRWLLLVLVPAVLGAGYGYWTARHVPKVYVATLTMFVEQPESASGGSQYTGVDLMMSGMLAHTYVQMIPDPVILRAASLALQKQFPGYFIGGVTAQQASVQQDTNLIQVSLSDSQPERARIAVTTVARTFIKKVRAMQEERFLTDERSLQERVKVAQADLAAANSQLRLYRGPEQGIPSLRALIEARQTAYQQALSNLEAFTATKDSLLSGLSIYSPATVSGLGHSPIRSALSYGFLMLLLFGGAILVYDYVNDLPSRPEQVEELAGAPILGTVMRFDPATSGQLITIRNPRSPVAEAYRQIRTNLRFTDPEHPPKTIVVTSALAKEGKTTTASNLAQVFAEGGARVLLMDSDLRRPSIHKVFGIDGKLGLTNMLVGREWASRRGAGILHSNLEVLPSGPMPPNPADLIGSARMQEMLEHLENEEDVVIIDSPPLLPVADASILSTMADGVILVVNPTVTKRREIARCREAVETVGGRIIGVIINGLVPSGSTYYYYYSHYGYQYQYGYATEPARDTPSDDGSGGGSRSGLLRRKREKQISA